MGVSPRNVAPAAAWVAVLLASALPARAQEMAPAGPWELSGFLGARGFSSQSALGAVEGSRASIASTAILGMRLGRRLESARIPSLGIEGELPLALSGARDTSEEVAIAVFEPRAHLRLGPASSGPIEPFAMLGLGVPIALSSKRYVVDSDILVDLYAGAGLRVERDSGWSLRADARAILVPARGTARVGGELELSVSLYRALGAAGAGRARPAPEVADRDGDGIPDHLDQCPDRPEDRDGFEDEDGCPDIDNDRDGVLDIVDRCPNEPETRNGYQDHDGCPDELPEALRELVPDPQALLFNSGSVELRASAHPALRRVTRLLEEHRSVRLLLVGHTDDQEDPDTAQELSLQRAEVVRAFLIEQGVEPRRLLAWGSGADHPADHDDSARGRLRNRRVTLQIWIPGVPIQMQVISGPDPAEAR